MPAGLQLSIIIVNYNVKYFLEQCLCSVEKAIKNITAEVLVVDNASEDGSVDYLQAKFPFVHFVKNRKNTGFANANNIALAHCTGSFVLFLNPDTILPEDCLEKCLQFMNSAKDAGALGIRMIDGCGVFLPESKRAFPSPVTSLFKLTGLSGLFPTSRLFGRYALGYLNEHENHVIDVLSGAFLLARKQIIDELGGFDDTFFMYGEDIDLSYRIQQKGWKNYYFSGSTIIHFKGESTKKGSLNYVKMFYKAMRIFVQKHYNYGKAKFYSSLIHPAIFVRAGVAAGFNLFRKKGSQQLNETNRYKKTAVVASSEEYEAICKILRSANKQDRILGRVALSQNEKTAIGSLAELNKIIHEHKIKEIIFGEGLLSFSEIISKIEKLPKGISVHIHSKKSNSIVGSASKDSSGEVVALNGN